jgi:hypothetical protein
VIVLQGGIQETEGALGQVFHVPGVEIGVVLGVDLV